MASQASEFTLWIIHGVKVTDQFLNRKPGMEMNFCPPATVAGILELIATRHCNNCRLCFFVYFIHSFIFSGLGWF